MYMQLISVYACLCYNNYYYYHATLYVPHTLGPMPLCISVLRQPLSVKR